MLVGVSILVVVTTVTTASADTDHVATWISPPVDVQRLLEQDAADRDRKEIPLRIGFPMPTDLATRNSGSWEELPDGGQLWRLSGSCP